MWLLFKGTLCNANFRKADLLQSNQTSDSEGSDLDDKDTSKMNKQLLKSCTLL